MSIEEIYEMQKELDRVIVKKYNASQDEFYNDEGNQVKSLEQSEFLTERLLALSVEVGELANATRDFKYWSTKKPEPKERILDEFADVLHFIFSVANSLDFTAEEIEQSYLIKHQENYKRQNEGY